MLRGEQGSRIGLMTLWDELSKKEIGIGYVEVSTETHALCTHRWVLDHGYGFVPTGLRYRPVPGSVTKEDARRALDDRWRKDSRLVVCQARGSALPHPTPAPRPRKDVGLERIERRGVWPVRVDGQLEGFILVPFVEKFAGGQQVAAAGYEGLAAGGTSAAVVQQNRYSEHWTMLTTPFPLPDRELVVAKGNGPSIPQEVSFFEEMREKMGTGGSHTLVTCETYVEPK